MKATGVIEELNTDLQNKVEERTRKLSQALVDLKESQDKALLAERQAAIGVLASGMAHDMNSPLNAIRLTLQAFDEELSDDDRMLRPLLSSANRAAARCKRLVADLLAFSREPCLSANTDLGEVVQACVGIFRSECPPTVKATAMSAGSPPATRAGPSPAAASHPQPDDERSGRHGQQGEYHADLARGRRRGRARDQGRWPRHDARGKRTCFRALLHHQVRRPRPRLGLPITQQLIGRNGGTIDLETELGKGDRVHAALPRAPCHRQYRGHKHMKDLTDEGRIHLLLVEDDFDSGPVVERMLSRKGVDVRLVESGEEALGELERDEFDIVVTDVRLGLGMTGVDLLRQIREVHDDLPVILITGFDSLNSAIQAVRLGAQDYILKPFDDIESLLIPVQKAVRTHRLEIQNRRLQRELEASESRFRSVLEHAVDIIFQIDVATGRFAYVSPSCGVILGLSADELGSLGVGAILEMVSAEDIRPLVELDEDALRSSEIRVRSRTNGLRWLSISASLIRDWDTDEPVAVVGTARDVTDVRRMKEQEHEYRVALDRADRMKSLAVLAGGVAHDLNNILMPILTLPDVMLDDIVASNIPIPETLREDLAVIGRSGERAAAVARDLLSLSRCQFLERLPVSINLIVQGVLSSGTVSEMQKKHGDVRLQPQLSPQDLLVDGSETHLYQAVLNLVVNAFEAMSDGGELRVRTELCHVEEAISGYERIEPGEYVRVVVGDTGHGIPPEIVDRVFEPFRSNKKKSVQSGTGLGLSVVYGVVKGHEGFVDLSSVVGHGTEFRLYFSPCRERLVPQEEEVEAVGGSESILLVDDEEIPRDMASRMLSQLGYEVTTAGNGHEALETLRSKTVVVGEPAYALVVLDMVMEDEFDGLDTYRAITQFCPEQPCLLISGFSDGDRVREAQKLGAGGFLQKPFSVNQLARKVRVEIDASR